MKKKLLCLFSVLVLCVFCLFGCGVSALAGGPSITDTVYGNGGMVVVKGDYIYFANAYKDYNELGEGENKYDFNSSQKVYGIYRAKLNSERTVDLDENGFPISAELMVPQVAGYSYSGLYICGDYLYYTSPFSGNKKSEIVKGLIKFERVKLDRTGHKILYTMEDIPSSYDYSINYINNITYISVLDASSNIIVLEINGENVKQNTIASDVKTFAVFKQENIDRYNNVDDACKYIYFTKEINDEYFLYRKLITNSTSNIECLISSSEDEIVLDCVKNNRVYYKKANCLISSSFSQNENPKQYTSHDIEDEASTGILSYYILNDTGAGVDRGILCVYYDESNYSVVNYYITSNGTKTVKTLFSNETKISILYAEGYRVYYKLADDESLYVFDNNTNEKIVYSFTTSIDDENIGIYDFDDEHVYYYNTVDSANNSIKYLYMATLYSTSYQDADDNATGHYIGVLDASNMK